MTNETNCAPDACKCPHHNMFGIWVALIGLTALLGNVGVLASGTVGIIWPVLLMLTGIQKAFDRNCKCCKSCKCCK